MTFTLVLNFYGIVLAQLYFSLGKWLKQSMLSPPLRAALIELRHCQVRISWYIESLLGSVYLKWFLIYLKWFLFLTLCAILLFIKIAGQTTYQSLFLSLMLLSGMASLHKVSCLTMIFYLQ